MFKCLPAFRDFLVSFWDTSVGMCLGQISVEVDGTRMSELLKRCWVVLQLLAGNGADLAWSGFARGLARPPALSSVCRGACLFAAAALREAFLLLDFIATSAQILFTSLSPEQGAQYQELVVTAQLLEETRSSAQCRQHHPGLLLPVHVPRGAVVYSREFAIRPVLSFLSNVGGCPPMCPFPDKKMPALMVRLQCQIANWDQYAVQLDKKIVQENLKPSCKNYHR